MNKTKTVEKGISDIVGVFTDHLIIFPRGWGDTLPEWLKEAITLERLEMNVRALKGGEMTETDAEACAYLYTTALTQSMGHDWPQIYLYIAAKTYRRWGRTEVPEDIRVDSLSDYLMKELNRLKSWIYRQRIKVRQERNRTERRHTKEAEVAKRKAWQPALFQF